MVEVIVDPERLDAVVFDLDGVVTDTASVHQARVDLPEAWFAGSHGFEAP